MKKISLSWKAKQAIKHYKYLVSCSKSGSPYINDEFWHPIRTRKYAFLQAIKAFIEMARIK